jgi:hypothetical protein
MERLFLSPYPRKSKMNLSPAGCGESSPMWRREKYNLSYPVAGVIMANPIKKAT